MLGNILQVVLDHPPPGSANLIGIAPHYPLEVRIFDIAALASGVADVVISLGGVALMAGALGARAISATALGVAALATAVEAIVQPRALGLAARIVQIVWLLALMCLVTGWRPRMPRWERESSSPDARSWMEDAFDE